MNDSHESSVTIALDARAYGFILLALSPLYGIWALAFLRRGPPAAAWQVWLLIAALTGFGLAQLRNKAVILDENGIVQGWWPFHKCIAYCDVARIHHIFVSNRYASTACLAISPEGGRKNIVLPMKSFSPLLGGAGPRIPRGWMLTRAEAVRLNVALSDTFGCVFFFGRPKTTGVARCRIPSEDADCCCARCWQ